MYFILCCCNSRPGEKKIGKEGEPGEEEGEMSDMEGSQVSLPRVVTNNLSRERRCITNKTQSSRFYLPSTNSSDGKFSHSVE